MDEPILAWKNLLAEAPVHVAAGTLVASTRAEHAANGDPLQRCLVQANASGLVALEWNTAAVPAIGFGTLPFGLGPFGGRWRAEVFILGAHRHEPAGAHFTDASFSLLADGNEVLASPYVPPGQVSHLWWLADHPPAARYRLEITTTPGAIVPIAEVYAGPVVRLPHMELGFDPYAERAGTRAWEAESGAIYDRLLYRRLEIKPRWRFIPRTLWTILDFVREEAFEVRAPVWFAWAPDSRPHEVYLVKQRPDRTEMPISRPAWRELALDLVEVV